MTTRRTRPTVLFGALVMASAAFAQGAVPRALPAPSGACPPFRDGTVTFVVGDVKRDVRLFAGATVKPGGPLIFVWHPTGSSPDSTPHIVGPTVLDEIRARGGVVAAPFGSATSRRPWHNVPHGPSDTDADQRLMDEVVGCALKAGTDPRRIHSLGFSAGGLKSAQVGLRRSAYIASVVVYSGGLAAGEPPPDQDQDNKFAALILHGGAADVSPVDGIRFVEASERYRDLLHARGRPTVLCDHGQAHSVPGESRASAWRFLQDHPFGAQPSAYRSGLPEGFVKHCSVR